jgi:acyl dehydratase
MQISIGQKATRSITLTADHVKTFAGLSGDHNPLHLMTHLLQKQNLKSWWCKVV